MKALARAIGGSVVVTLPQEGIDQEQIHPGELLEVEVHEIRKSYLGGFKGIGFFTHEDEMKSHD